MSKQVNIIEKVRNRKIKRTVNYKRKSVIVLFLFIIWTVSLGNYDLFSKPGTVLVIFFDK